jgi:hypothetical protein
MDTLVIVIINVRMDGYLVKSGSKKRQKGYWKDEHKPDICKDNQNLPSILQPTADHILIIIIIEISSAVGRIGIFGTVLQWFLVTTNNISLT